MKTLKRIGIVGGAVALVLCWPLAVGQIGQNLVTNGVVSISNDQFNAELVSYDRGYFSSTAITRYRILDPRIKQQLAVQGIPEEWEVKSEIQHNLFSLSAHSTLPEQTDFPIQINTQTRLNGSTDYQVELDNWFYQSDDKEAFTMSVTPATLQGTVTILGEITYSLTIPSIMMDFVNGEQLQLANISGEGKGKQENGFWLGKQKVVIGSLDIRNEQQEAQFNLKKAGYEFTSTMDAAKQRFTSQHIMTADQVVTEEGEVHDVLFDFTLDGVNSEAFEQLSRIYQKNPSLSGQALNQALPLVEILFSQGFSLSLNQMVIKQGDGEFDAKWTLTVPEGTNNILQDPGVILPALTGNIDTFVSQPLASEYPQIQQGVDELVLMEMAIQDDSGYRLKAEIKDGNLNFANGQQIPLVTLLIPLMMQRGY